MSVMVFIVTGVAVTLGSVVTIQLTRKAWHSFHKLVGIKPEKMVYLSPDEKSNHAFIPALIKINVSPHLLIHLPNRLKQQLQRIDLKAETYQNWRDEQTQKQSTITTSENQFVLVKLMSEHLPSLISTYHNISERHDKLNQAYIVDSSDQALQILTQCLDDIEIRLNQLLAQCEQKDLNNLQVMKRYLNSRD